MKNIAEGRSSYSAMGQGRHDYEPSYAFSPVWKFGAGLHCHDFYELYIHLRGGKYYCIDEMTYQLEANQLLVVPPFTMHGHVGTDLPRDYERAFLYITPALLRNAGAQVMDLNAFLSKCAARKQYQYRLTAKEAQRCTQLIQDMETGLQDGTPIGRFSNHSRMLSFLQIVCNTVQNSNVEAQPVIVNEPMHEVLAYINDHFFQQLKLEDLAHQFGVSVSYMSHEFAKYTGRSVYDYILYRRVLQAKELINSGASLNETAYRCGFGDYSSFLRCFKKMSGMTPKDYRKMIYGHQTVTQDEE